MSMKGQRKLRREQDRIAANQPDLPTPHKQRRRPTPAERVEIQKILRATRVTASGTSTGEIKGHASSRPEGEVFICSVCGLDPDRDEHCTRCQGDVTDRTTEPDQVVERVSLPYQGLTGSPRDGVKSENKPSR